MVSAGPPIREGQIHRAWGAMVQTAGSTEPAIPVVLKHMSGVRVAIELACSLAASALRLPVPRGMLVMANPDELTGFSTTDSLSASRRRLICYGSVLRWPETARARNGDSAVDDFIWQRFCETATASSGAAWDELVANADRHAGNFVFDGNRYWLIDHDLALRPLAEAVRRMTDVAVRSNILEHRAAANQVATQLATRRPTDHGILNQPRIFESKSKALEALAAQMVHWRTGISEVDDVLTDAETVVRGIILRLPALGLQLTERLSKPTSSLKWTSTGSTARR